MCGSLFAEITDSCSLETCVDESSTGRVSLRKVSFVFIYLCRRGSLCDDMLINNTWPVRNFGQSQSITLPVIKGWPFGVF